jgi:hypothetical protein
MSFTGTQTETKNELDQPQNYILRDFDNVIKLEGNIISISSIISLQSMGK